jgi:catechol 2,3-dioxygenase-like lactoylglutathione lyase family enzyme
MLTKLTHVTLFVKDQDEALKFYTQKLGFKIHTDAMFGETMRWLTITPATQSDMELSLMLAENADEKALIGKQGGHKPLLAFACDDCEKTHETLKRNGVKIVSVPEAQPWGTSMAVEDLYGNQLYIVQG